MNCISPLLIRSAGRRDVVPCGKCNFCLQARRADWSFRLSQELRDSSAALFITFTYSDKFLPVGGTLVKRHVQLFFKRLRKFGSFRYYAVGEYGTLTQRPHYHVLLFNFLFPAELLAFWRYGQIVVGAVTPASIYYTAKYHVNVCSDSELGGRAPPFVLMSRRPGIGSRYVSSHGRWHRQGLRNYVQVNGMIGRLPRFYKDRIFSRIDKEVMASRGVFESDQRYAVEIERLSRLGNDDAAMCYDDRMLYTHSRILHKVNSLNKF